ncbi:hypothetical protein D3C72_1203850 [compost metagenome]
MLEARRCDRLNEQLHRFALAVLIEGQHQGRSPLPQQPRLNHRGTHRCLTAQHRLQNDRFPPQFTLTMAQRYRFEAAQLPGNGACQPRIVWEPLGGAASVLLRDEGAVLCQGIGCKLGRQTSRQRLELELKVDDLVQKCLAGRGKGP